jgi:hypothetical protein
VKKKLMLNNPNCSTIFELFSILLLIKSKGLLRFKFFVTGVIGSKVVYSHCTQ